MIKSHAKLSIQHIGIDCILVQEFQVRYPERLEHYMRLLQEHQDEYAGFLCVAPSKKHTGLYVLLDGHHRYVASIMTGRKGVLCVVIDE